MSDRHLLAPRVTPDGTVSWEHETPEIAKRIRDGDSTLGWLGDDRLSLHLNVAYATESGTGLPRWEIWRDHETVEPTLVMSRVAQRIDGDSLIRQLAAHDSRTRDMAGELIAARDMREAESRARFHDAVAEPADKLAWALGRDLDLPAQSGRVYPLGG